MAALVQTIPQQTATVPMLQSRPASSSSTFSSSTNTPTTTTTAPPASSSSSSTPASQPPSNHQQTARNSNMSWNSYNTTGSSGSYRSGQQVVTPTANSQNNSSSRRQSWGPQLRPDQSRTVSAPSAPQLTAQAGSSSSHSVNNHHSAAGPAIHISKDDSALPTRQPQDTAGHTPLRPLSTINIPSPSPLMNISSSTVAKTSPDRYRRGNRRSEAAAAPANNSNDSATGYTALPPTTRDDSHLPSGPAAQPRGHARVSSADDASRVDRPQTELAKRYRRRSWGNMDNAGLINLQLHLPAASPTPTAGGHDYFDQKPQSQHNGPSSIHSQSSASSVRDLTFLLFIFFLLSLSSSLFPPFFGLILTVSKRVGMIHLSEVLVSPRKRNVRANRRHCRNPYLPILNPTLQLRRRPPTRIVPYPPLFRPVRQRSV